MTVWRSDGPTFLVLDSRTGVILEQKRGMTFSNRAWSADGRYVAFQPEPDSSFRAAVSLLDMQKDQLVSVLGNGWDWSPDGKWLAVTQNPSGVLITTPDMAVTHWLDTPSCSNVAWRPVS
jgi:dipeptidyl aminopeptidase/acylaminoacyl peptidase